MAKSYSSKGSDAEGCTGKEALSGAYRPSKSDIGSVVRPPAAPGPDSKGRIAPVKQVGSGK